MASEFQKALLAKKMKREQKIAEQGADPCAVVDMNVSAKRRPLLESNQDDRAKETDPKKPKMSERFDSIYFTKHSTDFQRHKACGAPGKACRAHCSPAKLRGRGQRQRANEQFGHGTSYKRHARF
jgi:hypothetical protein